MRLHSPPPPYFPCPPEPTLQQYLTRRPFATRREDDAAGDNFGGSVVPARDVHRVGQEVAARVADRSGDDGVFGDGGEVDIEPCFVCPGKKASTTAAEKGFNNSCRMYV